MDVQGRKALMVLINRLVKPTIHEKAGLTKPGKVGDFFLIRESKFII
jgi:hypothetical protein